MKPIVFAKTKAKMLSSHCFIDKTNVTMNALIPVWKKFLILGLEEDSVAFDWTARATQAARGESAIQNVTATLIAKSDGIWAGGDALRAMELVSEEMGIPVKAKAFVQNGETFSPNQKICEWIGTAEAIVIFERTMINLVGYCSGIATQTHQLVKIVESKKLKNTPRITGTRKTLPGYRDLAIQSTLIGGAYPHRFNLSGGLLLKENHIAAAGGMAKAVQNARNVIPHLLKIETEVRNLQELQEAIQAMAEVILLDNFTPEMVKEAIRLKPTDGRTMFEVSGGINLRNLENYVIDGVDVISIGSITHSVQSSDFSLLMNSVK